jgi:hypothetical protein
VAAAALTGERRRVELESSESIARRVLAFYETAAPLRREGGG